MDKTHRGQVYNGLGPYPALAQQLILDVFYRRKTQNTSYSYIEEKKRVFGANNMKIGWHIHPFGENEKHQPINHITFEEFLKALEKELKKRHKL